MVSDVLSEAVDRIENYRREMPDCYPPDDEVLATVVTFMDALQVALNQGPDEFGERWHPLLTAKLQAAAPLAQELRALLGSMRAEVTRIREAGDVPPLRLV